MKYDHDIIRDLIPLCIDGIASEKSQEAVKKHIAECPDCKKEWEQMKNDIQTCEKITLPEDTTKYKKTAERVRKHHRWMLLKTTCAVIASLFVIGIIGNFIDGARFTPEAAAKLSFKEFSGDLYETPEERKNAPKPEITVLGTIKSSDGKVADTYALIYKPDLDISMLAESISQRCDMLRMGMWTGGGGSWGDNADNGINMSGGGHSCSDCNKDYHFIAFYVTDKQVKNISFINEGKTYTLSPDEKGFCGMSWEMPEDQFKGGNIHEGTATDENGRVLYTIQQVTGKTDTGYEYTIYDWVKTE